VTRWFTFGGVGRRFAAVGGVSDPDAAVSPVGGVTDPDAAVSPVGGVADPDAAVSPVGGVSGPDAAVSPVGGVSDPDAAVSPVGGVSDPDAAVSPVGGVSLPSESDAVRPDAAFFGPRAGFDDRSAHPAETSKARRSAARGRGTGRMVHLVIRYRLHYNGNRRLRCKTDRW
jgi:hypothetical protein